MKNGGRKFVLADVVAATFAVTVALNLFWLSFAIAQEEKTPEAYELETTTVTAEKREENIQEVPISITSLSELQIEDAGILNTKDVVYQIPNFHIVKSGQHHGDTMLSIRGLSSTGDPTNAAIVGFYVDDVYYSGGVDIELLDVERIEVLRGPQGTLYGRNTEAGVINIITKRPGNIWEGKASVSYGNYNSQNYNAAIGGSLVQDKLFLRVSGKYFRSDGYLDNTFLDNEETSSMDDLIGRAILRYKPSDLLDVTLSTEGHRYRDDFNDFAPLDDIRRHPDQVNTDFEGSSDDDSNSQVLRLTYKGQKFSLTSITSRRNREADRTFDMDFTFQDIMRCKFGNHTETLNQEIRVSSPKESIPLKWLLGAFYFDEEKDFDTTYDMRQGFPAWGLPPYKQIRDMDLDSEGYAFFGQATYTLFDRLDITAGLRYDQETVGLKFIEHFDQDLSMFGMPATTVEPDDEDFDEWLPKFAFAYCWTQDLMSYANITKGYTRGGFNIFGATSTAGTPYDSEYSWNYEVGLKSTWLDKRLTLNIAAFYIDWKDQQVIQRTSPTEAIFKNAAESSSKGFEVEALARPLTGLELTAGLGYTDVEFDEFTDSIFDPMTGVKIGEIDYSGKKNAFVPEYTYNLGIQYRTMNGLFGRVDLLGVGDAYFDFANTEKQGPYELVNARLGYEREHFQIYLWAKNLFDKEYVSRAFEYGDIFVGRAGDPQTFGVTLTARF